MEKNNFNYSKICSSLLDGLSEKTRPVIERRFGLSQDKKETLEAIGKDYGITRERVRQIEREGILEIKKRINKAEKVFKYFDEVFNYFGDIKKEDPLLEFLGKEKFHNHIFFLLTLKDDLSYKIENKDFYAFWQRGDKSFDLAKKTINSAIKIFEKEKTPLNIEELYKKNNSTNLNVFSSHVKISKKIQKNPEGKIGLKGWLEITPKGVKDKAYLILRKASKPLHFTEVAILIEGCSFSSNKKIHTATVHNELIKDSRFVLVGRGLYALKEWGYEPGVVRDVIYNVLKSSQKPLFKEEIAREVLERRIVKENTVFLSLQDRKKFSKDDKGRYTIREA